MIKSPIYHTNFHLSKNLITFKTPITVTGQCIYPAKSQCLKLFHILEDLVFKDPPTMLYLSNFL